MTTELVSEQDNAHRKENSKMLLEKKNRDLCELKNKKAKMQVIRYRSFQIICHI